MFGKNVIHSPQSYTNPEGTLVVTSIFYTLQGEGPFAGTPCVFVRLKGCNLQCSFCDTYFDSGDVLTYEEIWIKMCESVREFNRKHNIPGHPIRLAVITGGEPTLQFNNLNPFLVYLHDLGVDTQIESNGVLARDFFSDTHLVCSPKVNEKTGKYIEPKPEMLKRIDTLKFVVSADPESPYYDIPEFALAWKEKQYKRYGGGGGGNVYISPMNCYLNPPQKVGNNGTLEMRSEVDERISFWTPNLLDPVQNQKNHEHAAFLAMKYGCKLNLQTHLYASLP